VATAFMTNVTLFQVVLLLMGKACPVWISLIPGMASAYMLILSKFGFLLHNNEIIANQK